MYLKHPISSTSILGLKFDANFAGMINFNSCSVKMSTHEDWFKQVSLLDKYFVTVFRISKEISENSKWASFC